MDTVCKTPHRMETGCQVNEDDDTPFFHPRYEATGAAPDNSLAAALMAQDVQNIIFDVLARTSPRQLLIVR